MNKWFLALSMILISSFAYADETVVVQQPQPSNQVIVKMPPQRVYVEDRPACVVNTMPVFDPQGNFVGYTSTKVCN